MIKFGVNFIEKIVIRDALFGLNAIIFIPKLCNLDGLLLPVNCLENFCELLQKFVQIFAKMSKRRTRVHRKLPEHSSENLILKSR